MMKKNKTKYQYKVLQIVKPYSNLDALIEYINLKLQQNYIKQPHTSGSGGGFSIFPYK